MFRQSSSVIQSRSIHCQCVRKAVGICNVGDLSPLQLNKVRRTSAILRLGGCSPFSLHLCRLHKFKLSQRWLRVQEVWFCSHVHLQQPRVNPVGSSGPTSAHGLYKRQRNRGQRFLQLLIEERILLFLIWERAEAQSKARQALGQGLPSPEDFTT